MKRNYNGRAVFLLSDHHCDMENIYLSVSWALHGYFSAISLEYKGYFKIISRVFQCDSWVHNGCAKGGFELVVALTSVHKSNKPFWQKKILKHLWSTTPIYFNPSGNTHEITLKHPKDTCKIPLKHQQNTHLDMYFPCHNEY